MNPSPERGAFEEFKRQLKEQAVQKQEKISKQIDDFKAFIDQEFADFIASIDNFNIVPNPAIPPFETPPQSDPQQQATSSSSSDDAKNNAAQPQPFLQGCKEEIESEKEDENENIVPIDLSNKSNIPVSIPARLPNIKLPLLHLFSNQSNTQQAEINNSNSEQGQQQEQLIAQQIALIRAGQSAQPKNSKSQKSTKSSVAASATPSSSTSSHNLIIDEDVGQLDDEHINVVSSKKKNTKKSSSEASPRKRSSSTLTPSSSKRTHEKEKRRSTRSKSRSRSRSQSRHQSHSQVSSPKRHKRCRKSRISRNKSPSYSADSKISSDDSQESSNSSRQPKFYDQFIVESLFCSQPECEGRKFDDFKQLQDHLQHEHRLLPLKCPLSQCEYRCHNRSQLSYHSRQDHPNLRQWTCDQCDEKFGHSEGLFIHSNYKHSIGEYQCSVKRCHHKAYTKCEAYEHFSLAHMKNDGSGKLNEGVVFRLEAIRLRDSYSRGTAEENFKKIYTFKNTNPKIDTLQIKCFIRNCPEFFADDSSVKAHMETQHQMGAHICNARDCGASFWTSHELMNHAFGHRSIDFKCSQCPAEFDRSSFLHMHSVIYHEIGLYKCRLCGFSDRTRIRVVEHYDFEHGVF